MKPRYAFFFTGLALAVVAIAAATLNIISLWWLRGETTSTSYSLTASVDVQADCGSVTVRGADVERTRVTMHTVSAFREPVLESVLEGTTRTIQARCPWSFGTGSTADITVTVPRSTEIAVRSASSGVDVENLAGPIEIRSSDGEIEGRALAAADVSAHTSDGPVRLSFAQAPARVDASSSTGSVTVLVPRNSPAYRVQASSSTGKSTTEVRTNPESARTITVRSSDGNVRVGYVN